MSGNYDPRYSPSTRFSIGRRTESETFYTFNNGLINNTDGFGSDFMRPGDRVESLVLPTFGADAAGNALFRGLKFLGLLNKQERIIERWIPFTYTNRDSLEKMSVQDINRYGVPRILDSFYFKGSVKQFHNKVRKERGIADTTVWERGYILK
jgi:hypothetical protein